jgi:hypothetical protein
MRVEQRIDTEEREKDGRSETRRHEEDGVLEDWGELEDGGGRVDERLEVVGRGLLGCLGRWDGISRQRSCDHESEAERGLATDTSGDEISVLDAMRFVSRVPFSCTEDGLEFLIDCRTTWTKERSPAGQREESRNLTQIFSFCCQARHHGEEAGSSLWPIWTLIPACSASSFSSSLVISTVSSCSPAPPSCIRRTSAAAPGRCWAEDEVGGLILCASLEVKPTCGLKASLCPASTMQSNPPNTPAIFVMTEDGWREIRHFFEIMARPRTLRLHWTVFFLKFIDSSDIRFSSVSSTGSSQGNLGALVPDFIDDSGMLRQAIPHARGGDDQAVAFAGEEQLQIAPLSSRPLIVVQPHGLGAGSRGDGGGRAGDARRPGRADQSRKFTAAVAVALEVSSGSGDAKADQIKGSGAKRVSGEASTSRLQVIDVDCGRTHGLAVIQEEGKPAVVRGWGGNDSGQLGLGGFKPASPIMSSDLPLLGGLKVSRVFCGWDFSMAVLGDGRVMCWGANEAGQLGLGLSGIRWKEVKSDPTASQKKEFSTLKIRRQRQATCAPHPIQSKSRKQPCARYTSRRF